MHEYFLGLPRKIVIIRASVAKKISAIKKTFVTKEKKISAIKKNIRASRRDAGQVSWQKKRKLVS